MRNLMIIAAVLILAANASAVNPPWIGPGATADIPVVMEIIPIATLIIATGTVIELLPAGVTPGPAPLGTLDYTGVASPSPQLTCNVPVTVSAETVGVAPLVTTSWQTALQGNGWSTPPGNPGSPSVINVDPAAATPANPFVLDVAVLATNVDMTVRPLTGTGPLAVIGMTTVTVVPRP